MIGVIGAGAFGTAMASLLHNAGKKVVLWGRDANTLEKISKQRTSPYLGKQILPKALPVTQELSQLSHCDIILLAIPAQKLRAFLTDTPLPNALANLVICAKGIEQASGLLPSQILQEFYPKAVVQVLSGPAFAADLVAGLPSAMRIAGIENAPLCQTQQRLSGANLRLYRGDDLIGVQLCGALKNVYAIGCGAVIGAGLGESAHAALVTRAIAELCRLCKAFGANAQTVYGLAGIGDLMLTGSSEQSRNFRYGKALGAQTPWDSDITVEGNATAYAVLQFETKMQLELPIAAQILAVIQGNIGIDDALKTLMQRELRAE